MQNFASSTVNATWYQFISVSKKLLWFVPCTIQNRNKDKLKPHPHIFAPSVWKHLYVCLVFVCMILWSRIWPCQPTVCRCLKPFPRCESLGPTNCNNSNLSGSYPFNCIEGITLLSWHEITHMYDICRRVRRRAKGCGEDMSTPSW